MNQYNRKKALKFALAIFVSMTILLSFQNCSDVEFKTVEQLTSIKDIPIICDPLVASGAVTSCDELTNGLVGEIFYFLNKEPSLDRISPFVYDVQDNPIPFPGGITTVEMFFQTAFRVPAVLFLSRIETPTVKFTTGFFDSNNKLIQDENGQALFEAFAIRVNSYLKLTPSLGEGHYEFALLSDDGSILELDLDQSGQLQAVVNNDKTQATTLGCSENLVELKRDQLYPLRLKYFQGPRSHIALTLLMRKVDDPATHTEDSLCGHVDSAFFGQDPAQNPNYVPEYVNSKFGQLLSRGWFVPPTEMFVLPK